ncbi:class I SAM-dependent methyltransferase [[Clostridium] dakarense]|uniref:class I SAM-dependent methyltransferase n=1 Tax=Faecalimicrobium dakarense TaxID=1301100 RepID=UPI0004B989E9|nr:methyltransferase domain-containing protein [[Clostridium] dakarense]
MSTQVEYDKMNWLYNYLYKDMSTDEIKNLDFIKEHRELLTNYSKKESVLIDVACGNRVQATALAIQGYNTIATDISMEMIKLANEFSKKHNVKLDTYRKAWIELPNMYSNEFDIVFCTGNSLVHSPDFKSRNENLKALSSILNIDGTLVVETRNWEKIIKDNKKFTAYSKISYEGIDYVPLYHWNLNGMENESNVEIIFQEINKNGDVTLYESSLSFTPFSHDSLVDMMIDLGLEITKDTYDCNEDWYYIYGKKLNYKLECDNTNSK